MRILIIALLAAALGATAACYHWLNQPLPQSAPMLDLAIEPGTSAREVAQGVVQAGMQVNPALLYWWFRLSGQSRQIKAGSYEIDAGTTPRMLLNKLVQGEEALRSVTLLEGWTITQVRTALAKADQLKPTTRGLNNADLMAQLGHPGVHPEGRFFPDTYTYAKGSTDLALLARAMRAMDRHIAQVWQQRDPKIALLSPEQVLVLASLVEKETGRESDRSMVSSVFNNRLAIGMRLQTDPSVIYGLGEAFDGNLRRVDLLTDTPWNTYTRAGLPPTPIAMPGKASLLAAVRPAASKALYFVARGDGSSQFSASLDEHNRAVNKYQRGQ